MLSSKANHTLQRTDESVRCVSVFQWVESISVIHGKDLDSRKHWRAATAFFFAQAETDTKSDSRLVKHRRAAAARRTTAYLLSSSALRNIADPSGLESLWACKLMSTCFYGAGKHATKAIYQRRHAVEVSDS